MHRSVPFRFQVPRHFADHQTSCLARFSLLARQAFASSSRVSSRGEATTSAADIARRRLSWAGISAIGDIADACRRHTVAWFSEPRAAR